MNSIFCHVFSTCFRGAREHRGCSWTLRIITVPCRYPPGQTFMQEPVEQRKLKPIIHVDINSYTFLFTVKILLQYKGSYGLMVMESSSQTSDHGFEPYSGHDHISSYGLCGWEVNITGFKITTRDSNLANALRFCHNSKLSR
jgi:hypothetical protein